jgi:trans-L-3-hydroxyproline dehydratase
MKPLKTVDAHAEGGPLRLVVDGFPAPRGQTMLERRDWAARHADHLRRSLMLEPRGHADMCGAVLTEPVSPGSHAGLLFMNNERYAEMCGHGIIAVTTMVLERGLLMPGGDGATIVFDTPAGTIRARASSGASGHANLREGHANPPEGHADPPEGDVVRVERVSFLNVPSFVLHGGLTVRLGARRVRADVAFGGVFYAIVDSEAAGLPIDVAHVPELRRAGMEIKCAIEAAWAIAHPLEPRLQGIHGTIFTSPPHDDRADLRTAAVFAIGAVDRSPSGTGAAAILAVLDAIGLVGEEKPFVCESVIGTRLAVRVAGRTAVGEYEAIVPEIEGSAWITGEQTFFVDEADPLGLGFLV